MLTGILWSPVSLALMNVFFFFLKGVKITPILLSTQKTIKDAKILFLSTTNGDWCEEGATGDKEGQWRSLQKHIHSAQFKEAALKGAGVMKVQQGGSLPQNQPHRLFSRSNKIIWCIDQVASWRLWVWFQFLEWESLYCRLYTWVHSEIWECCFVGACHTRYKILK